MEAVIFCGIQASGKTSFYRERFFDSHVRISLGPGCARGIARRASSRLASRRSNAFVVDNMNPTGTERQRCIGPAPAARFRVVGYFFEACRARAIGRNEARTTAARIPVTGILGTHKRFEAPDLFGGFEELYRVRITGEGRFALDALQRAVSPCAQAVEGNGPTRGGESMSDLDPDATGLGQQPGADVGDDGDIPDDPLLSPPAAGAETTDVVGGGGMSEAALGGGEGDLGGGGGMADDFGNLDDEGTAA